MSSTSRARRLSARRGNWSASGISAIELHLEGLESVGRNIPRASKIEEHLEDKDYAGDAGVDYLPER